MRSIYCLLVLLFCAQSAIAAKIIKVGKNKVIISNEGERFRKGQTLGVQNRNKKLVAKLKVLKTSKSKTLAQIVRRSKTKAINVGAVVFGPKLRSNIKTTQNSSKKIQTKAETKSKLANLELRVLEDQVGNFSASYVKKWRDKKFSVGGILTMISLGKQGSVLSQEGFSAGLLADYGFGDYLNTNGFYLRASAELSTLSVEFDDSDIGKVYGAELIGASFTGAIAYRLHFGEFNINAGTGLRYSTIPSSIESSDGNVTATDLYGGATLKLFASVGYRF